MVGAFRSTFARTETSQLSLKTLDGGAIKGNRHINYDNTRFKREKYTMNFVYKISFLVLLF